MLTLTASQMNALAQPTVRFRTLVDLDTTEGTYRFAREDLEWSGLTYIGRLLEDPTIEVAKKIGNQPQPWPRTTVQLADADGFFAQRRPSFMRNRALVVREIFTDVPSWHVRRFDFVVTGTQRRSATTFTIDAEGAFGQLQRTLFPSNSAQLTRAVESSMPDLTVNLHATQPYVIGETLAPLLLINDVTSQETGLQTYWWRGPLPGQYFEWTGADIPEVRQRFNAGDYIVESAAIIAPPATSGVSELITQLSPPGNPLLPHYARAFHASTNASPQALFRDVLTNSLWGASQAPDTTIDSATMCTAGSYWQSESWGFHAAITERQAIETLIDEGLRDSLSWIGIREGRLAFFTQYSRTAVASLGAGQLIAHSLTYEDIPAAREFAAWTVDYHERTTTADEAYRLPPNASQTYSAGAGTGEHRFTSILIGDPVTAAKLVRRQAKYAAYGQRTYQWNTSIKQIALEPGDVVMLTDSYVAPTGQLVEITSSRRTGPIIQFSGRDFTNSVFADTPPDLPAHPVWARYSESIPYGFGTNVLDVGEVASYTLPCSLSAAPTVAKTDYGGYQPAYLNLPTSLVAATPNSVELAVGNAGTQSVDLDDFLIGWLVRVV